jgi:hypothetical protein
MGRMHQARVCSKNERAAILGFKEHFHALTACVSTSAPHLVYKLNPHRSLQCFFLPETGHGDDGSGVATTVPYYPVAATLQSAADHLTFDCTTH